MIAMALWIISYKNVKTRVSKSPSSAIIKKASRACLGMNYLFYPCTATKAINHTRRTILELLVLRNSRIPKPCVIPRLAFFVITNNFRIP